MTNLKPTPPPPTAAERAAASAKEYRQRREQKKAMPSDAAMAQLDRLARTRTDDVRQESIARQWSAAVYNSTMEANAATSRLHGAITAAIVAAILVGLSGVGTTIALWAYVDESSYSEERPFVGFGFGVLAGTFVTVAMMSLAICFARAWLAREQVWIDQDQQQKAGGK
jgi:hypothetical protein